MFIIMCRHCKKSQVIKSESHIPELNVQCNYCLYYSRQVPSPSTIKAVSRNSWSILEEVLSMGQKLFVRLHCFCFWNSGVLIKACRDRTAQCVWNSWLCVSTAFYTQFCVTFAFVYTTFAENKVDWVSAGNFVNIASDSFVVHCWSLRIFVPRRDLIRWNLRRPDKIVWW